MRPARHELETRSKQRIRTCATHHFPATGSIRIDGELARIACHEPWPVRRKRCRVNHGLWRDPAAASTSNDSSAYLVARYNPTTPISVLPVARTASTSSRSLQLKQPHQCARLSRSRRFIRSRALAITRWRRSSCPAASGSWPRARSRQRRASLPVW